MAIAGDGGPPLITTVIPTFRRARLLRRAITSVLDQQGVSLRASVYDNASGDDTSTVVRTLAYLDPRLQYHCHPTNLGGAANFDYALRHVDTPYFSILSDDDYLLPGFYQHALAGLAEHPDAMFWVGVTLNVDEAGVIWDARVARWPRVGLYSPPDGFLAMTGGRATAWTGMLFRREVLELVGLPDPQTMGPSDLEFVLRLAARYPYVVDKHPSAAYLLNNNSFSATQPLASFWPGWKKMTARFETDKQLDDNMRGLAGASLRRDGARMLWRRGVNAIAARRLDFARDAADALDVDCGFGGRACLLRGVAAACARSELAQFAFTLAYRGAERRIVRSRSALQAKFGHLLKAA